MHCEAGVWHANVTVFGAWGPGLGYTFDSLVSTPTARRRMIERGHPWFSLIDLELPPNERRAVPMALHLASITGTVWAPDVEAELFACADAVVFFAETASAQLDRTLDARRTLAAWMASREQPIVVFQLDTPYTTVVLEPEVLHRELAIGAHPAFETNAREHRLGTLFRTVVEQLLAARDQLSRRPSYDRSTGV